MAKWMAQLEEWLGGGPGGTKRVKTFRWLLLIGLIGAALMLFSSFAMKEVDSLGVGRASPPNDTQQTLAAQTSKEATAFKEYEQAYESQLRDILQQIVGVGDVEVLVTVDSTEEVAVEKNLRDTQQVTSEKDVNGATRNITDVTRSGDTVMYSSSGNQAPLVQKYIKPKIRGVLIVAKGAENVTVKKLISDAVERGLDVPPHRISIVPRKQ
ncbi:stage III sporulation protein AG [Paenibacillus sp. MBLB4367]|uniref:stage III sporulation protein AG n=1 Tax=Paenibacillus sp. MBLB4367 TaxID=3384767 RepID=UPI003907EDB2